MPDHPRSRGVYCAGVRVLPSVSGSSPLARGLLGGAGDITAVGGIIPARAGFTERSHHPGRREADHPRSRGVYPQPRARCRPRPGSSPLARGLPRDDLPVMEEIRIIPARAGFTLRIKCHFTPRADHPRSRGVYVSRFRAGLWPVGSSPLARGLPGGAGVGAAP